MRILIIDYLSPTGHVNFDQIHINSILNLGHKVHLVGRKGQFPAFEKKEDVTITNIPDFFYKSYSFPVLTERVLGVLCLIWIRYLYSHSQGGYDSVVFLSYDILTLPMFRISIPVYLINHNNVDQLDNIIKLYLTRHIPSNYCHVALNEYMYDRLKSLLPSYCIYYVPHGCLEPTNDRKPSFVEEDDKFIFCPVNRNYNASLMRAVMNSVEFNRFLEINNIVFFVKHQLQSDSTGNIKVISILDDEEYNYLLSYFAIRRWF